MPSSGITAVDAAAKGMKLEAVRQRGALLLRRATSAKLVSASSHLLFRATVLARARARLPLHAALPVPPLAVLPHLSAGSSDSSAGSAHSSSASHRSLLMSSASYRGAVWEEGGTAERQAEPGRSISVLVTGAAGFVGTHCSLALKARGDACSASTTSSSYYDPSLKRARQALLASQGRRRARRRHQRRPAAGEALRRRGVHARAAPGRAGRGAVRDGERRRRTSRPTWPGSSASSSGGQARRPAAGHRLGLLLLGVRARTDAPFSEDHRTDRPASLYAATKKASEAIAHTYSNHIYGLSITASASSPSTVPGVAPTWPSSSLPATSSPAEPITLFRAADGSDARATSPTLTTSSRAASARSTPRARAPAPGPAEEVPRLSRLQPQQHLPVPVTRMVAILEKLLGKKANKRIVTMPSNGDVPFTHANVSHAAHDFGYRPTTSLEASLRHAVDWFVNYYKLDTKIAKGARSTAADKPAKKKKGAAAMSSVVVIDQAQYSTQKQSTTTAKHSHQVYFSS
ncbi:unnamed protein product [Miscanthus lutarioriparius]|uniref:NAD-dependent epimerase/dehydratase domain-containing protein n=1 Tax=Miscanthus lutarioriparius TaxID=422564 RepID=A0A811MZY2_9POAL|nr:unnamed protein product [Miscanthus lutarioriparius]